MIFCRNVLMYLEANRRHVVLERMASLLTPEGLLMLDPTEHLGKAGHLFTSGPTACIHVGKSPGGQGHQLSRLKG